MNPDDDGRSGLRRLHDLKARVARKLTDQAAPRVFLGPSDGGEVVELAPQDDIDALEAAMSDVVDELRDDNTGDVEPPRTIGLDEERI